MLSGCSSSLSLLLNAAVSILCNFLLQVLVPEFFAHLVVNFESSHLIQDEYVSYIVPRIEILLNGVTQSLLFLNKVTICSLVIYAE